MDRTRKLLHLLLDSSIFRDQLEFSVNFHRFIEDARLEAAQPLPQLSGELSQHFRA